MNNYLEILSVPAIAAIVYWIIEIIKYAVGSSEKFKRFIPLISCLMCLSYDIFKIVIF